MSDGARTKAAVPAKKTPQPVKKAPAPSGLLRQQTWELGAVEPPRAARADSRPLDPETQAAMESRLGHDFSRIRIHTGPEADASARGLGAFAYTLGLDVHFGAGRYRPDQPAGQALLAHELEHVVRAGPQGPEVPRLQPNPAADDEAKLREIFAAAKNRPANLRRYLAAHPQSIEIAERLLTSKVLADSKATVQLLRVLFSRDPGSEERVAKRIRLKTNRLRRDAEKKTKAMWQNYEEAAYESAVAQWAEHRLKEEAKRRPRARRGSPPPEPTAVELQLEQWRAEAQGKLDKLAEQRKTLLAEANAALQAVMDASQPVPYVQEDFLDRLSDTIHGSIDEAHRERIRSFEDVSLLALEASPAVERQIARSKGQVEAAKTAEADARAKRIALEPPAPAVPPAVPETPAQKRARERKLRAAKRTETAATARLGRAERKLTPEGAGDRDVARFLRSQVPATRAEAQARLNDARTLRNRKLRPVIPKHVQQPGVSITALLDSKQRWWIYHTALNNIGTGFPGFSYEHSIRGVLIHRSAVAENRKALGVDYDVSVDTYNKHGEGQYDIHVPAGQEINAVQPDQVDLTRVLGKLSGSTDPRLFERVSSSVRSAAVLDASDGDEDVLAKLSYGYFGRDLKDRAKMTAYLSGLRAGLPKPAPDASRIIAGITFDNTIAGSPPSAEVEKARTEIRQALEAVLHAELRKLTPPVDIPDDVEILRTVDASTGSFGGVSMLTKQAYDAFQAVPGRGRSRRAYSKDAAKGAVFKITGNAVLSDPTVSAPLEKLLTDLFAKARGNRSGPWVTLIHKYHEAATGKEAWIEVDYRHLHDVAALKAGDEVEPGSPIAKVGSSGNAVSPHIHMAIRVYESDPRTGAREIGYLVPLDFFPFRRR